MAVSNPNGVNLHTIFPAVFIFLAPVSNPNGVNLHFSAVIPVPSADGFKPQRGKFTLCYGGNYFSRPVVSNPNGVNLHLNSAICFAVFSRSFKPQRGKFTQVSIRSNFMRILGFKPQRGKFTQYRRLLGRHRPKVSNPNGVNLHYG